MPESIYWHLVVYFTTVSTVSLLSAAAGVVTYRLLRDLGADSYLAVFAVIGIWLGTLAFPYSTLFFSHQFCAAFLAFAFYILFKPPAMRYAVASWGHPAHGLLGQILSKRKLERTP